MDEKIVSLFWDRDEEAIKQTEQLYGGYLQKIAHNILSDREDSRECVNDACLAAWRSIPPYRPKVLRSYLAKLTRQIAIDRLRNRKSLKRKSSEFSLSLSELSDTFSAGDSVEEALDAELLRQAIGDFLHTLPKEAQVAITIGREKPISCYVLPDEPQVSCYNGVEYTLTRYTTPDESIDLFGEATINNCYYTFSLHGTQKTITQNEADFALILQTFSESCISPEELAAIQPREIPVMFSKPLSHEEALSLAPYGSYFLRKIPSGFTEESIRHYQDQHAAYLSGLWTRGYDELSWRVSGLAEEDRQRLTRAEEAERYDLSLYPIPRADSVPEALREVVDNPIFYAEELSPELIWTRAYKPNDQGDSNGWGMAFSVLYDDRMVTVRCKGVDPDWLYDQLAALCP